MIKKLTYKQKVQLLIIGVLFAFIVVSKLAIKRTIDIKHQCNVLELKLEEAIGAPDAIKEVAGRLKSIESIVGKNILGGDDAQELILEASGNCCAVNGLTLRNLPRPHKFNSNNYSIETCVLEIEGGFIGLLKLVYLFEQEISLGRIVSINFNKEEDRFTKRNHLTAKIYIQNIKMLHHEN